MSSDGWRAWASGLATDIMERFLVPREPSDLLPNFADIRASLPSMYSELAGAFETNILAVAATVSIPVTLASAAAEGSHWQRIHSAERIRALKLNAEPGEDEVALSTRRDEGAFRIASERVREFVASRDGKDKIAADACAFLLMSLKSSNLSAAASELILQGTVLT
jgi:hypothetical protein